MPSHNKAQLSLRLTRPGGKEAKAEHSTNKGAWRPTQNPTAFTSATFVLAAVAACDKNLITHHYLLSSPLYSFKWTLLKSYYLRKRCNV